MITTIGGLIQVIVLCLINFFLLGYKEKRKEKFLLALFLAGSSTVLFFYIGILGVFIPILLLMLFNYRFTRKVMNSVFPPLFALMVLVLSDHLSFLVDIYLYNVTVEQMETKLPFFILHMISYLLFSACFTLGTIFIIKKIRHKVVLTKKYGTFLLVLLSLTIIFLYVNILVSEQAGFSREVVQLNSYIFVLYFLIFITIGLILLSSIIKELQWKNRQDEYKQLRTYSENLEEMYGELRKFKHDYINILSTMSEYIRKNDMEQLEKYFNDKVLPTGQDIKKDYYKLGDLKNIKILEIKGVLVSKLVKAQDSGVDVNFEAVDPVEEFAMDPMLLSRCLGIILDNAIEETQEHDNSIINIAFVKREKSTMIVVLNTIGGEVPTLYKIYEQGYSTKGSNRGLGLSNLKEITSKTENVTLETKVEGRIFFQEIEIFHEGETA
ncbi:sensor histidine kinase [Halobacillus litoralis]|uniref:sensor histidine kinase n=1 Tax=Halobacillus litoralis TaxID=45668 RepID=UPI0013E8A3EA|nr:GHKL domain-containing protein [Halobacillus litoralis]